MVMQKQVCLCTYQFIYIVVDDSRSEYIISVNIFKLKSCIIFFNFQFKGLLARVISFTCSLFCWRLQIYFLSGGLRFESQIILGDCSLKF